MNMPSAFKDANIDIPESAIAVGEFAPPDRMEHTPMLQAARRCGGLRAIEDKGFDEINLGACKAARDLIQVDRRMVVMEVRTYIEDWCVSVAVFLSIRNQTTSSHSDLLGIS